jgi:CRP/FNR family transcriptional regulator
MSLSSCFFNSPSKSFAVAEEDTDILCVPVQFISIWQLEYKEWNDFVISTFRDRYDELLESFNCVVFNNIETRIIAYLKNYVTKHQTNILPFTHIQLANELGTTRVVTSRILKKFEQENKLKLLRGKIEIIKI